MTDKPRVENEVFVATQNSNSSLSSSHLEFPLQNPTQLPLEYQPFDIPQAQHPDIDVNVEPLIQLTEFTEELEVSPDIGSDSEDSINWLDIILNELNTNSTLI